MAILIDESSRVLIQGITGREGQARARLMLDYGTKVIGGVTPGKGGESVFGLPVFNSCADAMKTLGPIDISVLFIPANSIKPAAIEALDAGIKLLVLVADRVPVWDAMHIAKAAKAHSADFVGPNTLGIASPGKAVVGMIGGRAESAREWFKPPLQGGTGVGIISRSGGMSSSTAYYLGQAGIRISSIVHIGGDAVLGLRIPDVARLFQADPATDAIVVFGEIGGSQEEELAGLISSGAITKPVAAYIGGKAATAGTRFSHAGAIIEGNRGTHAGKVSALRSAGATVADSFGDLPQTVATLLRTRNSTSLMTDAERKAVWTTAITRIEPNRVAVRGHDIASLMGKISFGAAVYLILTGKLPDEETGRLMDAILVSSIDHGATPPSALAARTVASTGASLSQSVAAGIMSINKHHGGAIEDCARYLGGLLERTRSPNQPAAPQTTQHTAHMSNAPTAGNQHASRDAVSSSLASLATAEVARIKSSGDRIPGFGHRIHTKDPRTATLFELAAAAGLTDAPTTHIGAARAIEHAFAAIGKPLPINVDGALGAILADLGLDPRVFNGIFMIARTPGLVAHVTEEQTRERPMRRIDPVNHAYDGPSPT